MQGEETVDPNGETVVQNGNDQYNFYYLLKFFWLPEREFENEQEFLEFLKIENTWAKGKKVNLNAGVKQYYRCNYVTQRAKKQCNSGIFTKSEFHRTRSKIILYRKTSAHNHEELTEKSKSAKKDETEKIRKKITDMYASRLKPTTIRHQLRAMEDIPKDLYKEETYGKGKITMNQLAQFFEKHKEIPENQDDAFIVMFARSKPGETNEKWFRYFVSTKRLLKNAINADILHADGTYKLNVQGYPVLVIGSTDAMRRFHLIGNYLITYFITLILSPFHCRKKT